MSLPAEQLTHSVCEIELIEVIGVEDTLKLERAFGASYLYIPARGPSPKIIKAIGLEAGRKLVDYFGCGDIWIPKVLLLKERNQAIKKAKGTGKTIAELAAKFKLSTSSIKRVLQEKKRAR